MRLLHLRGSYDPALVDDEDFEAAQHLSWRVHAPSPSRTRKTSYAVAHVDGRRVYLHLWLWRRWGRPAVPVVEHKSGDGLDCTRLNLRDATVTQNNRNRGLIRSNRSGLKGVYWSEPRSRWHAQISVDGRRIHLGYFEHKEHAAAAYDSAALRHHGAFAILSDGRKPPQGDAHAQDTDRQVQAAGDRREATRL